MLEPNDRKVEAILFAVGKEITVERISSLCSLDLAEVEKIITHLVNYYDFSGGSLKLVKKDTGWKLTVKDEFVPLVSSLVASTELDRPLMETLAIIAWKYPIIQSDVVKLRGSSAYEHMRLLEEQGFVDKERSGRSFKLKLTKKFFEYFDLPSEEAKQAFLNKVPAGVLQEAEEVSKEADEQERKLELEHKEMVTQEEIRKATNEAKKEQ